jgi:ribonuclease HII
VNYLVGTDEAGYGPNLGPLVISATVWQLPVGVRPQDLYCLLQGTIVAAPAETAGRNACIAVADSKALYPSARGLYHLERGLLAALAVLGHRPATCRQLWDTVAPDAACCRQEIPWYADFDGPVPVDAAAAEIEPLAATLSAGLASAGVRLVAIRSRALFEPDFNRQLAAHSSKGAALSHATLDLVAEVCRPLEARAIRVICDKHGGRNAYHRLLADHFPESLIEIYEEGAACSRYRFGPQERRVDVSFEVRAESYLPTALASMTSKYLRELAMASLNAFWSARVPGLRRTAGYPQDARRFKTDIAAAQAELGIDDGMLWRAK